jgi:hypothetical protein
MAVKLRVVLVPLLVALCSLTAEFDRGFGDI